MRDGRARAARTQLHRTIRFTPWHAAAETLGESPPVGIVADALCHPASTTVLTAPMRARVIGQIRAAAGDRLLAGIGNVQAGEALALRIVQQVRQRVGADSAASRGRSAGSCNANPARAPSCSCMAGVREAWMPAPMRPTRKVCWEATGLVIVLAKGDIMPGRRREERREKGKRVEPRLWLPTHYCLQGGCLIFLFPFFPFFSFTFSLFSLFLSRSE